MRARLLALLVPLVAGAGIGCASDASARLVVESDTLVINGPRAVPLEVHAFTSDGRAIKKPRLKYSLTSDVAKISRDGAVSCHTTGDAVAKVIARNTSTEVSIHCRPIRNFGFSFGRIDGQHVWAGGPPFVVPIVAFDSSGRRITEFHATARLRDDSLARFQNGQLYPLRRGNTRIDLDFDGVRNTVPLEVVDRIAVEKLRMAGGEMKTWRGDPGGWYEIRLDQDSARRGGLVLAAFDANCAKAREGDQHYYCIAGKHGSFIVKNLFAAGSGIERQGELSIYRKAR